MCGTDRVAIDYVDDARGCSTRRARLVADVPGARARRLAARRAGRQDITADVVREQLVHAARARGLHARGRRSRRPSGCATLGIDELVEDGRRSGKRARTSVISRRSRAAAGVSEARALTDPPASAPTAS